MFFTVIPHLLQYPLTLQRCRNKYGTTVKKTLVFFQKAKIFLDVAADFFGLTETELIEKINKGKKE